MRWPARTQLSRAAATAAATSRASMRPSFARQPIAVNSQDSYSYFSTPSSPTARHQTRLSAASSNISSSNPFSTISASTGVISTPSSETPATNFASSSSSSSTYDVYPASLMRSDSHNFTVAEFDAYRLFAILASCAASSDWLLLTHMSHFIPASLQVEAAEAILPVQVFSGIPRTIEGCAIVRQCLDERAQRDSTWLLKQRQESLKVVMQLLIDNSVHQLMQRLAVRDLPSPISGSVSATVPTPSTRSLSPRQPSLPPLDASYPPVCPTCRDNNSTAARMHRGRQTLNVVYGAATTDKLLASLAHSNLALEQSVQQHIYGHVLCTPLLTVQAIELISIACLTYVRTSRQVFSHVRGALMNGLTRPMCERVLSDAEAVFRHADKIDHSLAVLPYIEDTRRLIVKIDEKVNPRNYAHRSLL